MPLHFINIFIYLPLNDVAYSWNTALAAVVTIPDRVTNVLSTAQVGSATKILKWQISIFIKEKIKQLSKSRKCYIKHKTFLSKLFSKICSPSSFKISIWSIFLQKCERSCKCVADFDHTVHLREGQGNKVRLKQKG